MKLPELNDENGHIKNLGRTFSVFEAQPISSLCLFHSKNKFDTRTLKKLIMKAKEEYGKVFKRNDFIHVD